MGSRPRTRHYNGRCRMREPGSEGAEERATLTRHHRDEGDGQWESATDDQEPSARTALGRMPGVAWPGLTARGVDIVFGWQRYTIGLLSVLLAAGGPGAAPARPPAAAAGAGSIAAAPPATGAAAAVSAA